MRGQVSGSWLVAWRGPGVSATACGIEDGGGCNGSQGLGGELDTVRTDPPPHLLEGGEEKAVGQGQACFGWLLLLWFCFDMSVLKDGAAEALPRLDISDPLCTCQWFPP